MSWIYTTIAIVLSILLLAFAFHQFRNWWRNMILARPDCIDIMVEVAVKNVTRRSDLKFREQVAARLDRNRYESMREDGTSFNELYVTIRGDAARAILQMAAESAMRLIREHQKGNHP